MEESESQQLYGGTPLHQYKVMNGLGIGGNSSSSGGTIHLDKSYNNKSNNSSMHDSGVGAGHGSDSGYTSYHSFNVSTAKLAVIVEENEANSSFEESPLGAAEIKAATNASPATLTPETASSVDKILNFHLTTPDSGSKRYTMEDSPSLAGKSSAAQMLFDQCTPEKYRNRSIERTPPRSNRKLDSEGVLTPKKGGTKFSPGREGKRSFRGKLLSDGDLSRQLLDDGKVSGSANVDEDFSPIYGVKRSRNSVIDDLIRSSTPKTASAGGGGSSAPNYDRENINWDPMGGVRGSKKFRKFQSFSPSKMHSYQGGRKIRDGVLQEVAPFANVKVTTMARKPSTFRRQNAIEGDKTEEHKSPTSEQKSMAAAGVDIVFDSPTCNESSIERCFLERSSAAEGLLAKSASISALLSAPIVNLTPNTLSEKEDSMKLVDSAHQTFESQVSAATSSEIKSDLFTSSVEDPSGQLSQAYLEREAVHSNEQSARNDEENLSSDLSLRDAPVHVLPQFVPPITDSEVGEGTLAAKSPPPPVAIRAPLGDQLRRLSAMRSPKPLTPERPSFVGIAKLNIMVELKRWNSDVLPLLFAMLGAEDLVSVAAVCCKWRNIVRSDAHAKARVYELLVREAENKENLRELTQQSSLDISGGSGSGYGENGGNRKLLGKLNRTRSGDKSLQPFGRSYDSNHSTSVSSVSFSYSPLSLSRSSRSIRKSPPVSPSKKKFHDNQKIASNLKRSERLTTCPRCQRFARVQRVKSYAKSHTLPEARAPTESTAITATSLEDSQQPLLLQQRSPPSPPLVLSPSKTTSSPSLNRFGSISPLTEAQQQKACRNLFASGCAGSSPSSPSVSRRRRSMRRVESAGSAASSSRKHSAAAVVATSDYAICSGQGCGFTFCVKCFCEHHPNSVCSDLAPNSPSKEEEPAHNIACSNQSRRSLMRLCKK